MAAKGRGSVCGYTLIKTEHPTLVIFETVKGDSFAINKENSVSNLDIFACVNSKFVCRKAHSLSNKNNCMIMSLPKNVIQKNKH